METTYTLFTEVRPFYSNLLPALAEARQTISLMYFTFDAGQWSAKMGRILQAKAAEGVHVRLMVDELGLLVDAPSHALRNQELLKNLQTGGIEVIVFRPQGRRLSQFNRLHCKVAAIDQTTAFIGGSNIGDHYLHMHDTNLRLDGPLGPTFHHLYDYLAQFSEQPDKSQVVTGPKFPTSGLQVGRDRVLLTLPHRRQDIRRALLGLILEADKAIYIRNWYFLPDKEILNALLFQAENGVKVSILCSHRTRVPLVDAANYIAGHKLAKAGAKVWRYNQGYMHAKVAWNNRGDIIFGSANMDEKALSSNFECCLQLHQPDLAGELQQAFTLDLRRCLRQTPQTFRQRPWTRKAISYACSFTSAWL